MVKEVDQRVCAQEIHWCDMSRGSKWPAEGRRLFHSVLVHHQFSSFPSVFIDFHKKWTSWMGSCWPDVIVFQKCLTELKKNLGQILIILNSINCPEIAITLCNWMFLTRFPGGSEDEQRSYQRSGWKKRLLPKKSMVDGGAPLEICEQILASVFYKAWVEQTI